MGGRAGKLLVKGGNLVKSKDSAVVGITRIKPAFVTFAVPENRLGAIREAIRVRKVPVEVSFQNDPRKRIRGILSVIDNTADVNTGTIRLKATLQNEAGLLWPGQFVNVTLMLDTLRNATVVPSEAGQPGQQGQFGYEVKADKAA